MNDSDRSFLWIDTLTWLFMLNIHIESSPTLDCWQWTRILWASRKVFFYYCRWYFKSIYILPWEHFCKNCPSQYLSIYIYCLSIYIYCLSIYRYYLGPLCERLLQPWLLGRSYCPLHLSTFPQFMAGDSILFCQPYFVVVVCLFCFCCC